MLIKIDNKHYIDLLLLISPLINKKLDDNILDFDVNPTSFSLDHLKDTLLHHTEIGEQYMIQQVQEYLNPSSKPDTPNIANILEYQQLQDIKYKHSNIISKQLLESLDLENHECLADLLNLMSPFRIRTLENEVILLENILEKLKNSNQEWWFDFEKEALQKKISRLLEITSWMNNQSSPTKEALFLYYQKNIKLDHSLQSYESAYQQLQNLCNQADGIWTKARLMSHNEAFYSEVINNICNPNQNHTPQIMLSNLQKLQDLDEDTLVWLDEQQISKEKISIIQQIQEILLCIKDSNMRNIYFSYTQTHLDLFSSMQDLNDFYIFLQNKLVEQDLNDLCFSIEQNDLENKLIYIQAINENACNIPLIDTIKVRLDFLTKIYSLMQVAHKINQTPLDCFQYFLYLFLYFFGYQTPNYHAQVILQVLQDILQIYFQTGLNENLIMNLTEIEKHQIFKKI